MPHLSPRCCSVLELRQYTLHPGQLEVLLDVFERALVESQEDTGMHVVGTFSDLDDPERFVWFRGFASHVQRAEALGAFYGGSVWGAHSAEANATMKSYDDTLLLRSATPLPALPDAEEPRPATRDHDAPRRSYGLTVLAVDDDADEDAVVERVLADLVPRLEATGARVLGLLRTDPTPHDFPALPVREGERVVVVVTSFADEDARAEHDAALSAAGGIDVEGATVQQHLRLRPTDRSELR